MSWMHDLPTYCSSVKKLISVHNGKQIEAVEQSHLGGRLNYCLKSNHYSVAVNLYKAAEFDTSYVAFVRGFQEKDCVPCLIVSLGLCQRMDGKTYPFFLEGAIRGDIYSMQELCAYYYDNCHYVLAMFWDKLSMKIDTDLTPDKRAFRKKRRKSLRIKHLGNKCFICGNSNWNNDEITELKICGACKSYTYCSKKCQFKHWYGCNHIGECRRLKILHAYCKVVHVQKIRDAICGRSNSKEEEGGGGGEDEDEEDDGALMLATLREKLGLNRGSNVETTNYTNWLVQLDTKYETKFHADIQDEEDEVIFQPNGCNDIIALNDGTVPMGSTNTAVFSAFDPYKVDTTTANVTDNEEEEDAIPEPSSPTPQAAPVQLPIAKRKNILSFKPSDWSDHEATRLLLELSSTVLVLGKDGTVLNEFATDDEDEEDGKQILLTPRIF